MKTRMNLIHLLREFPELELKSVPKGKSPDGIEIAYIQSDSRRTNAEDIFCVSDSLNSKKEEYISSTKASVILIRNSSSIVVPDSKIVLETKIDPEQLQGRIASFLLGHPSKELEIVAVTGTNGKTSLTNILFALAKDQGRNCGLIGTIGVKFGDLLIDTGYTTPDASSLNLILKEMKDNGVDTVFMEASSHGLKLGRINGISVKAGVFTNLTQDHLDFHPDMEDYFESKFRLFEILDSSKSPFAVLDYTSPGGKKLLERIRSRLPNLRVSALDGPQGEWKVADSSLNLQGTSYTLTGEGASRSIHTNLLGSFNVRNTALAWI
ncbi:UDP-N-acetylmuramoyl-L-alanyl-D-glutamate--2,6-diaminopimelate ligase, partial [Leptospira adleri]